VTEPARPAPPGVLLGAVVLVGLEGLFLGVLAVLEVVSVGSGRVTLAVTTGLFFLALGAGLLVCAWSLARVHSWARGPVVACQLIGVLLSFSFWGGDTTGVAVAILVVSLAVLVGVLHPASMRAMAADEG
jgi:hypothetical protein